METKQCSKCKEVKSTGEFYRRVRNKDGFDNACKECKNKGKKIYSKQCKTCDNPFDTFEKRAIFCSKKCVRIERRCVSCKVIMETPSPFQRYCSEKCREDFFRITAKNITEKKCGKCGITKSINEFHKSTMYADGKKKECKECQSKNYKKKYQEKKLKEYMEFIGYEETDKTIPAEIDLNQLKVCTNCKLDKSLKEFRPVYVKKKFNRFHAHCHECASIKAKEYRLKNEITKYREMHKEGQEMKNKGEI